MAHELVQALNRRVRLTLSRSLDGIVRVIVLFLAFALMSFYWLNEVILVQHLLNTFDVHFKRKKGAGGNGYFFGSGYAFKIALRIMSGTDRPS